MQCIAMQSKTKQKSKCKSKKTKQKLWTRLQRHYGLQSKYFMCACMCYVICVPQEHMPLIKIAADYLKRKTEKSKSKSKSKTQMHASPRQTTLTAESCWRLKEAWLTCFYSLANCLLTLNCTCCCCCWISVHFWFVHCS